MDLSIFALTLTGACLGFLLFNRYPAKVFMGDTGSLALGGGIAALALLTRTELLLIILGGIYVMEAASVIIQVGYFKKTGGKRIFRMTPIHHHFELGGWKETKIVQVFAGSSLLLGLIGIGLWCWERRRLLMTKTVLVYGTGISGCGAADALAKQGLQGASI